MSSSYICSIDRTLSSASIPSQSGPERDGNEGVLHIPLNCRVSQAWLSECLVSIRTLFGWGLTHQTDMQSVYSTAPVDWAPFLKVQLLYPYSGTDTATIRKKSRFNSSEITYPQDLFFHMHTPVFTDKKVLRYIRYVQILESTLRTCQRRWTIGADSGRGPVDSVLDDNGWLRAEINSFGLVCFL